MEAVEKDVAVNPQPAVVVIQPAQPVVEQAGCCCVPSTASGSVKGTRAASIFILIVHIIAVILAFFSPLQWVASLIGIIMSSVVLCAFTKCAYATAGVLYIVGAVVDIVAIVSWITWSDQFDSEADGHNEAVAYLTVPPAIGAVTFLVGAVFALKAVCNWKLSGAVNSGAAPLPA